MKNSSTLFLVVAILLSMGTVSHAQTRDRSFQVATGIGAGWNPPVRFDLDLAGEYFINDRFSAGLDVDIFVRGATSYNFLGFGRYNFYLQKFPRFAPYIGGGVGVLANSNGRGWFDIMAPEAGFLWELTPHLYLGPNVSIHLLAGPSSTTWDLQTVGQIAYRF